MLIVLWVLGYFKVDLNVDTILYAFNIEKYSQIMADLDGLKIE